MPTIKEKAERRIGEKLFLKGHRCDSVKCAFVRKPYPPGVHGNSRTRRGRRSSEYGIQLRSKQKLKLIYGLSEGEFKRYVMKAVAATGQTNTEALTMLLEERLDNTVFRSGFAASRRIASQLVSHGHILVNNRKVTVPSFSVRNGDIVIINPRSEKMILFSELDITLKKFSAPEWIFLDPDKKIVKIVGRPTADSQFGDDMKAVIEFYSR